MFGTKGINTQQERRVSKYISYGNNYLRINDITVKTAQSGSKQLIFSMETPKVENPAFEPELGFEGQVGKVAYPGSYVKLDNEKAVEEFNKGLAIIADKLGVRSQFDEINAESFDEYVEKVKNLLINKYAHWAISGEEYIKADGRVGTKLKTRRYKFIASQEEGSEALGVFDPKQHYNVKRVDVPDAAPAPKDDLPF